MKIYIVVTDVVNDVTYKSFRQVSSGVGVLTYKIGMCRKSVNTGVVIRFL